MYYNPSPPQESSMNLLISPFEPNQSPYPSNNSQLAYDDHNQLDYGTDQFDYGSMTQPLDVPMQQYSDSLDYVNVAGMSPVALTTEASMSTGYNNLSPSPQADTVNIFYLQKTSSSINPHFILTFFPFSKCRKPTLPMILFLVLQNLLRPPRLIWYLPLNNFNQMIFPGPIRLVCHLLLWSKLLLNITIILLPRDLPLYHLISINSNPTNKTACTTNSR